MRIDKKRYIKNRRNNLEFVAFSVVLILFTAVMCIYLYSATSEAMETPQIEAVDLSELDLVAEKENTVIEELSSVRDEEVHEDVAVLSSNSEDGYTTLSIAETSSEPDYRITVYEEERTLYTSTGVNVRKGPGTEYEQVELLTKGAAVTVTGETDNGWYQILRDGNVAYIKSEFLQEKIKATNVIFAGDSRTVQMSQAVKKSEYKWYAQVGEGYDYFVGTAIPQIDASVSDGSVIIINYGVNDLHNVDKYISKMNSKIDSWINAGATVYYAAVLPVSDYPTITNSEIESFNSAMRSGLDSRIGWLDGYNYLQTYGFNTADGLHFDYDTYRNLYAFYMSKITA